MLHLLAVAFYLLHFVCQLRSRLYDYRLYSIIVFGLFVQAITLLQPILDLGSFGFFTIMSLAGFGSVITVFFLQLNGSSCAFLQLWFVPVACLTLIADFIFTNTYTLTIDNIVGLAIHVFLSIAALSLVSISSVILFCGLVRNYQLKRHQLKRWSTLSMETMKNLSAVFLLIAWIALTLSVVSGLVFIEDFLARYLAHKTVFSLSAWCILTAIIFIFKHHQMRWLRTFILCAVANLFLLIGYFGSRFVVEFILS